MSAHAQRAGTGECGQFIAKMVYEHRLIEDMKIIYRVRPFEHNKIQQDAHTERLHSRYAYRSTQQIWELE